MLPNTPNTRFIKLSKAIFITPNARFKILSNTLYVMFVTLSNMPNAMLKIKFCIYRNVWP